MLTPAQIEENKIYAQMGMTDDEYALVKKILRRQPNYTEIGLFSVMWSEHCSYKNTKVVLRKFPTKGPRVLQGPGEGAGVVDIGDGIAAVFKLESHNHPSALEPFDGAATGVGGIVRDVFSMGARPIAVVNSLRFGEISAESDAQFLEYDAQVSEDDAQSSKGGKQGRPARTKFVLKEAVRGMADYGNKMGITTAAGEIQFDDCYASNPLVNAMCVGILRHDGIKKGIAIGAGNLVIYAGHATGRDGVQGASFASKELAAEPEDEKPIIPAGDPVLQKRLMEACLEIVDNPALVGIQDMGAAGLISSSSEMASKGGMGVELNLDAVPVREENMTPYEMMLSESQERMLLVVKKGHEQEIIDIFAKHDINAAVIGKVTDDKQVRLIHKGEICADVPADALANEAPEYHKPSREAAYYQHLKAIDATVDESDLMRLTGTGLDAGHVCAGCGGCGAKSGGAHTTGGAQATGSDIQDAASGVQTADGDTQSISSAQAAMAISNAYSDTLLMLLAQPTIASKHWVYSQFDKSEDTLVAPGSDAGIIRVPGTTKALAMTVDCNSRYVYLDPYIGGKIAVAEAARNIVASGATPLAITDNLNFGSPENPEIFWQLEQSAAGISEACLAFDTPVIGGNVSLYNERGPAAIYPTPTIGMVGLIDDLSHITTQEFINPGDAIYLVGTTRHEFGGSELQKMLYEGKIFGPVPSIDLSEEKRNQDGILAAIRQGLVSSVHDVSEGGVAVCLAECLMGSDSHNIGADITIPQSADPIAFLFAESQSRYIVSCPPSHMKAFEALTGATHLGYTNNSGMMHIKVGLLDSLIHTPVAELTNVWKGALEQCLQK